MFSPLAFPDGAMLYDLITHVPPPSHLALTPFDLYREPLAIIALADGTELQDAGFSKRHSANGTGPTMVEKNIRALYQELEDIRDNFPKALVHQALIFDYAPPGETEIPIPEGVAVVPPEEDCVRTTLKTVMCDVSSLLLAEMTTLAKSFEAMSAIDSPGHYALTRQLNGADGAANGMSRRNSQFALPQRAASVSGQVDRSHVRMSMPPVPSRPAPPSSNSTPGRPSTPTKGQGGADGITSPSSTPSTPEQARSVIAESSTSSRDTSRDRVSVQGFGPGGANDKWRLKGKGRTSILLGSMYLMAGRWSDSLKELSEGATAARSLNDHVWHGKALELIVMNLLLLGWSKLEFTIPSVLYPQERPRSTSSVKAAADEGDPNLPTHIRRFQNMLPELLERIVGLYSRISSESLPPLPLSETSIRFSKLLSSLHLCEGSMNQKCLDMLVLGTQSDVHLTTSPRLSVTPSRQQITAILFKAFPSSAGELLTTADRASILSGIASVLGILGLHRKKAMVVRELVSVLIGGLVEARTRGAADAGVHPAAGLVSMTSGPGESHGSVALDLSEGDVEQGIEAFLGLLCKAYGVVSYDVAARPSATESKELDDSAEAVISRIKAQAATRFFGFPSIKLNILRACINFSEALPDFNGVLKFSSDLLRSSGSGIAPGPRREDASSTLHREEQMRLVTNISRTSSLVQRLGLSHLASEYWDEFLVRGIQLEPLPPTRLPIPHAKSVLPGATTSRASQDVNPFIYNPFLKKPDEAAVEHNLVADELATFKITMQNPFDVEVDVESVKLDAQGLGFEAIPESTVIGPYRTQILRLTGRPKETGPVSIVGAIIKVRGCRERRFPVFAQPWVPRREPKIKAKGLSGLQANIEARQTSGPPLKNDKLSLKVIQPQPLVVVKSTTLPQSSVMILEGERQTFSITLQNLSPTPVDFLLFSFKDSTQEPLQAALSKRDATPAELYEYELILAKKQALRLPRKDQGRSIAPGGEATFDFEILGKPGLTHAAIQADYTYLGVPQDELKEQFYTRQVTVDLTVTVNASVELARIDALPLSGPIPQALWERLGAAASAESQDYCLLSMDLRNAWPSQMAIRIEGSDDMAVEENVLPGNTCRVIMPVKKVYLENPHESVPTLNPSRNRQFVVSASKISPATERASREAFWYREKILDSLKATWRTTAVPKRSGAIELRNIRLTSRMIETIKVDEIGISISIGDSSVVAPAQPQAYVDERTNVRVHVTNRSAQPIVPLVRLLPALCHRPLNVALDYTRKLAWNGTLQQLLPEIGPHGSTELLVGMTPLCRGHFELAATVEEVKVWTPVVEGDQTESAHLARTSDHAHTQTMMDAALGIKERRVWHLRQPVIVAVQDREG